MMKLLPTLLVLLAPYAGVSAGGFTQADVTDAKEEGVKEGAASIMWCTANSAPVGCAAQLHCSMLV